MTWFRLNIFDRKTTQVILCPQHFTLGTHDIPSLLMLSLIAGEGAFPQIFSWKFSCSSLSVMDNLGWGSGTLRVWRVCVQASERSQHRWWFSPAWMLVVVVVRWGVLFRSSLPYLLGTILLERDFPPLKSVSVSVWMNGFSLFLSCYNPFSSYSFWCLHWPNMGL